MATFTGTPSDIGPMKPGDIVIDRYMKVARAVQLMIGLEEEVDEAYSRIG